MWIGSGGLSNPIHMLSHSLDKWCTLDISYCATQLNNLDIKVLIGVIQESLQIALSNPE
jgi:hypothetical protein